MTTKTKPRYCHACITPTGTVPLVNGECDECREALRAHRLLVDGRRTTTQQEPAAVRRGLAVTERFTQAAIEAAYAEAVL